MSTNQPIPYHELSSQARNRDVYYPAGSRKVGSAVVDLKLLNFVLDTVMHKVEHRRFYQIGKPVFSGSQNGKT